MGSPVFTRMASGIGNFATNLLLEKLLRGTAGTFPTTLYVALYTATPSDTGGGTEVTGGGYARQPITVGTAAFAALALGATTNSAIINFGTASASLGTITQFGVLDAVTAGNLLLWGDLTTSQTVANGNPYSIAIGAMSIGII